MNRKIRYCQTLTHETVRSDNVSMIMDLDDGIEKEEVVVKLKYRKGGGSGQGKL